MNEQHTDSAGLQFNFESFHSHFEAEIRDLDRTLVAYLDRFGATDPHYGILRYHLGYADRDLRRLPPGQYLPRGKRLRPVICILFCRILNLPSDVAELVMMATEIMHAASLVHDDIEDKDAVRWGRPTVQSAFAPEQAINIGDALTGLAYHMLLALRSRGVEPAVVLDVIEVFNRTHFQMCEGQYRDLVHHFYDDVSLADYLEMVSHKTASQCVCIADTISILSRCPAQTSDTLRRFGQGLGMLYQICDDIRGIWCESDALGRSVGQDISQRRASLPLLYGFKHGSRELQRLLLERANRADPLSETDVAYVRRELTDCGAKRLCQDVATGYYQTALDALDDLRMDCAEVQALRGILGTCFASVTRLR